MTGLGVREEREDERGRERGVKMEKEKERSIGSRKFFVCSEAIAKEGEENQFTCIWSRKG